LRLSTFTQFLDDVTAEPTAANAPLVRGDWTNFWADGVAALPRETQAVGRAVRILTDLPSLAEALRVPLTPHDELIAQAWHDVSMFNEHTSDAYDAVSNASGDLSQGCKAFKASRAYEALAAAELRLSDLVRGSPAYTPGRHATHVAVINPSAATCSDWIELPLPALPPDTGSLVDESTGQVLFCETVVESVWSEPRVDVEAPYDRPRNTFGAVPGWLRAFVPSVSANGQRTFRYGPTATCPPAVERGWSWEWDTGRGRLTRLAYGDQGQNWVGSVGPGGLSLGTLLFDTYPEADARWALTVGDRANPSSGARRVRSTAVVDQFALRSGPAYDEARISLRHHHCHRIEQRWLRHRSLPRVEIETTLWLKEIIEPVVGAMAFSFGMPSAEIWYTSLGHPTRVGHDQMPGACGAYTLTEGAVGVVGLGGLVLAVTGAPLMAFGRLDIFSDSPPSPPQQPSVFNVFACTRWMTNFPHVRPVKLRLTHRLDAATPAAARRPSGGGTSLYTVPTDPAVWTAQAEIYSGPDVHEGQQRELMGQDSLRPQGGSQ
jgi:hypothetical protein